MNLELYYKNKNKESNEHVAKSDTELRESIIGFARDVQLKREDFIEENEKILPLDKSIRSRVRASNCSEENRKNFYNEHSVMNRDEFFVKKKYKQMNENENKNKNGRLMESAVSICLPLWFSEEKSCVYRTTDYDDLGREDYKGVDAVVNYKVGDDLTADSIINLGLDITSNIDRKINDVATQNAVYSKILRKMDKHILLTLNPEKKGKFIKYGYDRFNDEKKPMVTLPLVVGFAFEKDETKILMDHVFSLVNAKKQNDEVLENEAKGKIKDSPLKYVLYKEIEDQLILYSNYGILSKGQMDFFTKVKKATVFLENKINAFDEKGQKVRSSDLILRNDDVWCGIRNTINTAYKGEENKIKYQNLAGIDK